MEQKLWIMVIMLFGMLSFVSGAIETDAVYPAYNLTEYYGNYTLMSRGNYTNWAAGEPDGTTNQALYTKSGTWYSESGAVSREIICELGDGEAYYLDDDNTYWDNARNRCFAKGWGWHLAHIDDATENEIVGDLCDKATSGNDECWLDLDWDKYNSWERWYGGTTTTLGGVMYAGSYYNETMETSSQYFRTNLTIDGGSGIQSARLYMNSSDLGTRSWGSTINSLGSNDYSLENTIDIPVITGSNTHEDVGYDIRTFYHEITYLNGSTYTFPYRERIFTELVQSLCRYPSVGITYDGSSCQQADNAGMFGGVCYETYDLNNPQGSGMFLNTLIFLNETTQQESVNATFIWTFDNAYLGSGTETKDFTFTQNNPSTWNVGNFNGNSTICSNSQGSLGLKADTTTIQYTNAESQQRTFSTTEDWSFRTNTTLWLLPTSLGTFVTTIVQNVLEQSLQGATITWTRDGFNGIIEQTITDAAGSATFWLNPNFVYNVLVSKTGVGSLDTQLNPTQSTYTFILGQTYNVTTDYREGVSMDINPRDYYLTNDTIYDFNMTINSSLYDLGGYGFTLQDLNGSILTGVSGGSLSAGQEGFVSSSFNVGTPRKIFMEFYYNSNGTDFNQTRYYQIVDLSDTEYSLNNFFERLKGYLNPENSEDRIFGMNDVSFTILLFLIIISLVGVLSYSSGLYSPSSLAILSFSVILLFDGVLGLIPLSVGGRQWVPTIIMGIFMIALLWWNSGGRT